MSGSGIRQSIYAVLSIAGLVVPWYFNIQFMQSHAGWDTMAYIGGGNANAAASSLTNDLAIAFVAFLVWLPGEAKRVGVRYWALYAIGGFAIAFAFVFPLFLFVRERKLAAR